VLFVERPAQRGGDPYRLRVVDLGEQVDVLGLAGDEAVRDHRATAGQGERVRLGQRQGDAGDALLQRIQRLPRERIGVYLVGERALRPAATPGSPRDAGHVPCVAAASR
jgi:hypothetical protein